MDLQEQLDWIKSGEVYNDFTLELNQARKNAGGLTTTYNQAYTDTDEVRQNVLKELLSSMGENVNLAEIFI